MDATEKGSGWGEEPRWPWFGVVRADVFARGRGSDAWQVVRRTEVAGPFEDVPAFVLDVSGANDPAPFEVAASRAAARERAALARVMRRAEVVRTFAGDVRAGDVVVLDVLGTRRVRLVRVRGVFADATGTEGVEGVTLPGTDPRDGAVGATVRARVDVVLGVNVGGWCPAHGAQPRGPGFCCPSMVRVPAREEGSTAGA